MTYEFEVKGRRNTRKGKVPTSVWMAVDNEETGSLVVLVGFAGVEETHQLLRSSNDPIVLPLAWVDILSRDDETDQLRVFILLLGEWLDLPAATEVTKRVSGGGGDGPEQWSTRIRSLPRMCLFPPGHELQDEALKMFVDAYIQECRRAVR